jgi:hypothetical protein
MLRSILALPGTRKKKLPAHNLALPVTNLVTNDEVLVAALADYAYQTRFSMPGRTPSPKVSLFIWLGGEIEARATKVTP